MALLTGFIAGGRAISALQSWREYRVWSERDPSAADAYLTFARTDTAIAMLSLGLAGLVWWLLRPGSANPG